MQQLYTRLSFVILILICLSFAPVFSQGTQEEELVRVFTEMNRALGFCEGQAFSLTKVQGEFPELPSSAKIAELE